MSFFDVNGEDLTDKEDKITLTWKNYEDIISDLIKTIPNKYEQVFGMPKGGLIPAFYISKHFNIPMIFNEDLISPKTLVVDDVADSGKDIFYYQHLDTAVIVLKPWCNITPKFYAIKTTSWVQFPYEIKNKH